MSERSQFPTGRRLFALKLVRAEAERQNFAELVTHCDAALAHDTATQALERRWAGETPADETNPEAQRLDTLVDRVLTAIRDSALAQTAGTPDDDPIHALVANLLKKIFPTSVRDVTSLPYVEELEAIDAIVHLLQTDLSPAVQDLSLQRQVTRLADLAKDYRRALESPPRSLLNWGRNRAARAEGQGFLLETIAIILGKYHGRSAPATAARLQLLGPILRQNEALGLSHKVRRTPTDVNADTGEESLPAPGAAAP